MKRKLFYCHSLLLLFLLLPILLTQSCGAVGPPLPPEDIGIEAKIRSQQQATQNKLEQAEIEIVPIDQENAMLPIIQPLGMQ